MGSVRSINKTTRLGELLGGLLPEGFEDKQGVLAFDITGLTQDSRLVEPGDLFLALFGKNHDARDYIYVAAERGAQVVIADAGGQWQGVCNVAGVPVIAIDGLRARIGEIAARHYGFPGHQIPVIGVTGTNGKTSCTQFIAQILAGLEQPCGVIGTLGYGLYPDLIDSGFTTPDAIAMQSALADIVANQARYAALEVSSQGLHQHRLVGVKFNTAVFTNLTRDHLDYHGSMAAYAEAKRRLFEHDALRVGIVNADDPYAAMMLNAMPRQAQSMTYSVSSKRADVYAEELSFNEHGFTARVCTPWGCTDLNGRLLGAFNFSNVLAALTVVMTLPEDYLLGDVVEQISRLQPVQGRMDLVGSAHGVSVVVDYAHSPDGLRCALEAVRQHTSGRIWCVFGCGGNRDQGKRPLMAEVADQLADFVVITDDNPRHENPDDIVRQIMFGFSAPDRVIVERDRARAIALAVSSAAAGDVVLVAGKGHECYQEVAGNRFIFSDAEHVRLALRSRANSLTEATS
jgi:UDP-N-acetylmuramoyl-L-alanyl-D-glutamate--2,6-diaminopimelate ligase